MSLPEKKVNDKQFLSYLRSLGVFFPDSEKELERFNELYSSYEHKIDFQKITQRIIDSFKNNSIERTNNQTNKKPTDKYLYFRRTVLAAEIASQLYNEPTFGHVKFQKLVFLCEHAANLNLQNNYCKQAAGPFDRVFMHTIDKEFKRQKWFNVYQNNHGKYYYTPLENVTKYKTYYNRYFARYNQKIQWLINTFRSKSTDEVELIATLFACWDEAFKKNETITDEMLLDNLYNWSKEKSKYTKENVIEAIKWMHENSLYPTK